MLVWIDLETTGLDPFEDLILEVGTLITSDNLETVIVGPDIVIHQPALSLQRMDPTVRGMHQTSGLLDCVKASSATLQDAHTAVERFASEHLADPSAAPTCGNNIAFDRGFLAHHAPRLNDLFHYRSIDVSTVKELARRWRPDLHKAAPAKRKAHRSVDDLLESVEELRWYLRNGFFNVAAPDDAHLASCKPLVEAVAGFADHTAA